MGGGAEQYTDQRMKRTRQILAITLLAAALCADRAVASSPVLRPQIATRAGQLVAKLSVSFRRVVPSVRFYQTQRETILSAAPAAAVVSDEVALYSGRLSALLLRLPPPGC